MYIFNLTPIGKPRMTKRDRHAWSQTKAASMYFAWKDQVVLEARRLQFELGDGVKIVFLLPMPESWSKKKKLAMLGMPHQSKPDTDNMVKAFVDAVCSDDARIYDKHGLKFWWHTGKIVIMRNEPSFQNLIQIDTVYNALQGTKQDKAVQSIL